MSEAGHGGAREERKKACLYVEKTQNVKNLFCSESKSSCTLYFFLVSYLAAQLRDGSDVVDQGVGGTVGPTDSKH